MESLVHPAMCIKSSRNSLYLPQGGWARPLVQALPAWGLRQAPLTLLSAQKVGKWAFQVYQIACLAVDRATL